MTDRRQTGNDGNGRSTACREGQHTSLVHRRYRTPGLPPESQSPPDRGGLDKNKPGQVSAQTGCTPAGWLLRAAELVSPQCTACRHPEPARCKPEKNLCSRQGNCSTAHLPAVLGKLLPAMHTLLRLAEASNQYSGACSLRHSATCTPQLTVQRLPEAWQTSREVAATAYAVRRPLVAKLCVHVSLPRLTPPWRSRLLGSAAGLERGPFGCHTDSHLRMQP